MHVPSAVYREKPKGDLFSTSFRVAVVKVRVWSVSSQGTSRAVIRVRSPANSGSSRSAQAVVTRA